jgi:hypothetical protein
MVDPVAGFDNSLVQQLRFREVRGILLSDRRVRRDALKIRLAQLLLTNSQGNRFLQQLLQSPGANPIPPLRHARRVDRAFVLHVRVAAEVLPVGIFDPTSQHRLVRFVEGVLEVMQADHQADRPGRRAHIRAVTICERRLQLGPIDLVSRHYLLALRIEELIEVGLKQFKHVAERRFGVYESIHKLQGFGGSSVITLQNIPSHPDDFSLEKQSSEELFKDD